MPEGLKECWSEAILKNVVLGWIYKDEEGLAEIINKLPVKSVLYPITS